jgi:hypothetical protein
MSRYEYDVNGKYRGSTVHSETYLKDREGRILEGPTNWPVPPLIKNEFGMDYLSQLVLDLSGQDTVVVASILGAEVIVDDESCSYQPIYDHGFPHTYNTREGLIRQWFSTSHRYFSRELVGSVINGIPYGVTELPTTAVSDIQSRVAVIYPNPTTGFVYFQSDAIEFAEVYDIHGRMLWSGRVSNQTLDLCSFESGIYLLRMVNRDGHYSLARIVKQ